MTLAGFFPPGETSPAAALMVDGHDPAFRHLSHWPGHATPAKYRAPTSTEMALRWARDADRGEFIRGLNAVTNNHADTDGLLAAWVALHPDAGIAEAPHLAAAARAGDFGWYTSPKGVRLDLLVESYCESPESPLAGTLAGAGPDERLGILYGELLPKLPSLLHEIEEQRPLWEPGWKAIEAGFKVLRSGAGTMTDHPGSSLSVYAGPAIAEGCLRSTQGYPRLLRIEKRPDGASRILYEHDHHSWFDIGGNGRELRVALAPLAAALNDADPDGRWTARGIEGFDRIEREGVGEIDPKSVVSFVRDALARGAAAPHAAFQRPS